MLLPKRAVGHNNYDGSGFSLEFLCWRDMCWDSMSVPTLPVIPTQSVSQSVGAALMQYCNIGEQLHVLVICAGTLCSLHVQGVGFLSNFMCAVALCRLLDLRGLPVAGLGRGSRCISCNVPLLGGSAPPCGNACFRFVFLCFFHCFARGAGGIGKKQRATASVFRVLHLCLLACMLCMSTLAREGTGGLCAYHPSSQHWPAFI